MCVVTSVCTDSLMCAFWSCLDESSDSLIQEGGKFAELSDSGIFFCSFVLSSAALLLPLLSAALRERSGWASGLLRELCDHVRDCVFYICMNRFPRVPDGQMTTDWSLVDLLCCPQVCPDWKDAFSPSVCIPPLCNAALWTWSKILLQAKQRNRLQQQILAETEIGEESALWFCLVTGGFQN